MGGRCSVLPRTSSCGRATSSTSGRRKYRFISFNLPNLTLIEDNLIFLNGSPWRWPNEYEISDALESVRQLGGTVVRTYVLSVYRPGSDLGDHVFVRGPG